MFKMPPELSTMSEGKIITVMPIILDPYGTPFTLPPARYKLSNIILGYEPNEVLNGEYRQSFPARQEFPRVLMANRHSALLQLNWSVSEHMPAVGPDFGDTVQFIE